MNVALNISSKNIKVVSIEGRRVKKWGMAEIPPGLVVDGLINDPKTLGTIINGLFKKVGLPRDRVVAGIAGLSFTYRFLTLPHLKPDQLEEAILRAARKEISIPLDELYISWQRFPDIGNETSFFVLGIERNRVDAMVDTLKEAHIEPFLMGIRPLALTRITECSNGILVNIEENCFDIVFMSNGIPRVIHTINPRTTIATLEDNIHRLADELTKTAAFYNSNNPEAQLDDTTPLLITGDWAAQPAAIALLQTELDYPISRLVPQVEIPKELPTDSYTVAIGLALKKTPPKTAKVKNYVDANINILAGKYRKPKSKPVPITHVITWILLAAAVLLLYPLYQAWTNAKIKNVSLETQIIDVQRQINISSTINEEDVLTENQITELAASAGNVTLAYQDVQGSRVSIRQDLETVTSLIPENTNFSHIEFIGNDIFISGESDDVFTVVSYAASLEKQETFREVRIDKLEEAPSVFLTTGPAFQPVTVIQFTIVINKK